MNENDSCIFIILVMLDKIAHGIKNPNKSAKVFHVKHLQ